MDKSSLKSGKSKDMQPLDNSKEPYGTASTRNNKKYLSHADN
jgi:hypothetical protein